MRRSRGVGTPSADSTFARLSVVGRRYREGACNCARVSLDFGGTLFAHLQRHDIAKPAIRRLAWLMPDQ